MPYHLDSEHPDCDGVAVVKDSDGEVMGCHMSKAEAMDQMAALHANESSSASADVTHIVKRSFDFTVVRTEATKDDGLTMEGVAAVFNSVTRIDNWEGNFDEQILKGAFTKTLREQTPLIQFDHGSHPLIGSIPIGVPKVLKETDEGLFVRARLSNNWLIEPVRMAIADGAIRGMSIRFSVIKDKWDTKREPNLRSIHEVTLFELGPVVWPAYEATSVGIRSRQLQELLSDRSIRADLARALTFGSAEVEADTVTSTGATDKPPELALVADTETITEPIHEMPVRELDVEKMRETVAAYSARLEKIERTAHV